MLKMRIFSLIMLLVSVDTTSVSAQQSSGAPRSDVAFMQSTQNDLINSLHLKPVRPADALGRQIVAAGDFVDGAAGFRTPIWVCDRCGTSSHPTLGIIMDVSQVAAIERSVQAQYFQDILIFLIGHEKAHQRQFARYSSKIIYSPDADRQFYEAQADILGGMDLGRALTAATTYLQREALLQALKVASSLGIEQYAVGDHPSQNARVTAVRLGVAAGLATKLNTLDEINGRVAGMPIKKLHLRTGEDTLDWSLQTSKRIVNYQRPAILSLVRTSDHIDFDKSSSHPTVKYDVEYQNQGNRSIDVDLEIQCAAVPRDNHDDIIYSEIADTDEATFTLKPGATKRLKGEMRWIATRDLMPWIREAPDPSALVKVTYSGAQPSGPPGGSGNEFFSAASASNARTTAGFRSNIESALNIILAAGPTAYDSLRAGPGEYNRELKELFYPVDPQFPGSISTRLEIDKSKEHDSPTVIALLYGSSDPAEARQIYADTLVSLRSVLRNLGDWVEAPTNDGVRFVQGANRIYLSLDERTGGKRVTLNIGR